MTTGLSNYHQLQRLYCWFQQLKVHCLLRQKQPNLSHTIQNHLSHYPLHLYFAILIHIWVAIFYINYSACLDLNWWTIFHCPWWVTIPCINKAFNNMIEKHDKQNARQTYAGPYLGFECNFRFLQMSYFGRQVTISTWSTQITLVRTLPLQREFSGSQSSVEHLK